MPTMKFSGKNHTSILTRFVLILGFIIIPMLSFILFSNPKIIVAASCEKSEMDCPELDDEGGCADPCLRVVVRGGRPARCECQLSSIPPGSVSCGGDCQQSVDCETACPACKTSGYGSRMTCVDTNVGGGNTGPNPVQNCSNNGAPGIETALGCIPYEYESFVPSLLGFVVGIIGAIALVVMLVGTITIMTAGGNPEAVKKGKELFTAAITGLLFIIFSVALLRIVAGDIIKLPGFTQTNNTPKPTHKPR